MSYWHYIGLLFLILFGGVFLLGYLWAATHLMTTAYLQAKRRFNETPCRRSSPDITTR